MTVKAFVLIGVIALLSGACASTGATPRPFPGSPASPPAHRVPAPTPVGPGRLVDDYALVGTALELRGVPYRNGGSDRAGFDCSGFTQFVFAQYGLALPRETREQFKAGTSIPLNDLQPGDLIFFETTAPGPSHVAIAVGGNEFVHAPSSTGVVRVERLSSTYWSSRLIGVRRLIAN